MATEEGSTVFVSAIPGVTRAGRRTMVLLAWLLLLIALALATWASIAPTRADDRQYGAAPGRRLEPSPEREQAQPALPNQNVSGR
jgi:hypothetical protein